MLDTAFTLWGAPTSWLEVVAFFVTVVGIACNIRQIHWGWPFAIVASALYGWLFWESKLYGEAGLQGFFIAASFYGWWQWLGGKRDNKALRPARLQGRQGSVAIAGWLIGWGGLGLFMARYTDNPLPLFDAFATVGSVVATVLLAHKFIENWWAWIVVNAWSIGLFGLKGLYLTVILYTILGAMAVMGWRAWRRELK